MFLHFDAIASTATICKKETTSLKEELNFMSYANQGR